MVDSLDVLQWVVYLQGKIDRSTGDMKNKNALRIAMLLGLVVANIGCDQISKNAIREQVEYGEHIQLIGDTFVMTKVENTGAFLSAGSDLPPVLRDILLIYLPIVVMCLVLWYIITQTQTSIWTQTGMAFVLGGGIGNLIDRVLYGSVTDFLHIDLGIVRTGVFNAADMSIMIGLGLVLISSFQKEPTEDSVTKKSQEGEDAVASSEDASP